MPEPDKNLDQSARALAIVPAAGSSSRMGTAKTLLPLGDKPLIAHTLDAWLASRVKRVLVVVRSGDRQLRKVLEAIQANSPNLRLVMPQRDPADMKESVQYALRFAQREESPQAGDAWMLAPADLPGLSPGVIEKVLTRYERQRTSDIVVPVYWRDGATKKRGHPVLFRWPLAAEVFNLHANQGVNQLLMSHAVDELLLDREDTAGQTDVDTPEDYQRIARQHQD